jgi:hypothetical protein
MMENLMSLDFMARLKKGEFDEHLLETIASLSEEELEEVKYTLRNEADLRSFARQ